MPKTLLLFLALAAQTLIAADRPKHILLIMADDLGIEGLSCYGGDDYPTPNLDRMAEEGLRFTHAYSQPLCTPTRLEIMTGLSNQRNWLYFGTLPKGQKTFGHLMKGFGYQTCISGKWQLQSYDPPDWPGAAERRGKGQLPDEAGFDSYSLHHTRNTEDKGSRYGNPAYERDGTLHKEIEGAYGEDHNVDHILDFMGAHKDDSMFIYYPMALPHWPMVPTPDSPEWKDPSRRLEESTDYFPDMVAYMDKLIGRLITSIDEMGLGEDTLILYYADNGTDRRITSHLRGEEVLGGKGTPAQTGIRVPLIARWKGHLTSGVTHDLIDPSDFVPTLADLAGKPLPADWITDGVSFAPQLLGTKPSPRDWCFFWYDPRPGWDKDHFTRSIFALDHQYKLFSDGRLFDIAGETMREVELPADSLSPEATAAKAKLQAVIDAQMALPLSITAKTEVDAYGQPVTE